MTLAIVLLVVACRTSKPPGETAIAPLTSSTPREAAQQLAAIRDRFPGQRTLVRIRIMNGTDTFSAKAQVQVGTSGDMLITVYTPLNTTAARLYSANGRVVFLNDFDKTAWQGSAAELTGSLGFISANPAAVAYLLLGLPPRDLKTINYTESGIQSAELQGMTVAFDPPSYPPKRVVVVRGAQRIDFDHLEMFVSPTPIEPLTVPAGYRCCVMPQI